MSNANCQLPIADCKRIPLCDSSSIGNWKSAIGNSRPIRASVPSCLRAFSLVEMMIAIVILGLGLIMVATMFPVAWDRARTLSEFTVEQSAAAGAEATLESLLRPAGHRLVRIVNPIPTTPPFEELRLASGSLAGDLFFDPTLPSRAIPAHRHLSILAYADTSLHALNMENVLVTGEKVSENPWRLEFLTDLVRNRFLFPDSRSYPSVDYERNRGEPFPDRLFYGGDNAMSRLGGTPQVRLWQRMYPPMDAPPAETDADYEARLEQWNEKLATRRFCWAVLHRLRSQIGPVPRVPISQAGVDQLVREAAAAMGITRTFDIYYVTLRRTKPTNRYARQDPAPAGIPNPFDYTSNTFPVSPAAMVADEDVMFPAAWRVQVEFPPSLAPGVNATGIPTEIQVPAMGLSGEAAKMLVQMFPAGTQFVDEITGNIYRVAKRRIADNVGEKSILTLDREVLAGDLDLPAGDPRCDDVDCQPGMLVPQELLRTVWVYPPAVDRTQSAPGPTPHFDGPPPVVDIQVGTLSISPSS